MKGITNDELFKLMDRLSINEIGAFIAGASPSDVFCSYQDKYYLNTNESMPENASEVFSMITKILTRAIIAGELKAQIVMNDNGQNLIQNDLNKDWLAIGTINTAQTTITRNDIKQWLENRGVFPTAFFPNGRKDDYMNPNHDCYSPDLALCVKAWEVAQTAHYDGTTKEFMANWIKQNAQAYKWENHTNPKELMGDTKAKELASVANWNKKGGAAKGNPNLKQPTPPLEPPMPIYDELKINLPQNSSFSSSDNVPF
ncbi:hypothetical protein LU293_01665 [Moraxella nasovis]|uniref:hypothetical protein n=1 Tax=Moraxella nasovis TaxID=2904121 RepID=UPI001F6005EB|nr:hypothetical protein [Moraxella nasovis]UNU73645.1 hypothetical protein LU293_01665 [Moraxella nasovis]